MLKKLRQKLSEMFGNTLYYPGCLTHFTLPEIEEAYKKILSRLGISFIMIPEINCCGSPVLNAGYKQEFEELKQKNLKILGEYGISRIITNCPACYHFLKKYYNLNAEHITQTLFRNIDKIRNVNLKDEVRKISYHDPCHLGRWSNVYEEPRAVLSRAGFKVEEFDKHHEQAMCCGAGGGVASNFPETASKVARIRLKQCHTDEVVTSCPLCYRNLKNNSINGIEVLELGQLMLNRVGK